MSEVIDFVGQGEKGHKKNEGSEDSIGSLLEALNEGLDKKIYKRESVEKELNQMLEIAKGNEGEVLKFIKFQKSKGVTMLPWELTSIFERYQAIKRKEEGQRLPQWERKGRDGKEMSDLKKKNLEKVYGSAWKITQRIKNGEMSVQEAKGVLKRHESIKTYEEKKERINEDPEYLQNLRVAEGILKK